MAKPIAQFTVKFYKDEAPKIEASDGIGLVSWELFSKTLSSLRDRKQAIQVKLMNRARREERLKEQEELSNA